MFYRIADDYESHSKGASENPDQYLSNPLNAFLLVKRFTIDWERVENLIKNNTADGLFALSFVKLYSPTNVVRVAQ